MNDTDLSDESAVDWAIKRHGTERLDGIMFWQECRRRAKVLLEIKDKALRLAHSLHQEELEQERRKAFEAGFRYDEPAYADSEDLEKAWQAYLESKK